MRRYYPFCDTSHTTAAIFLLLRDRQLSMPDRHHTESRFHRARSHLKPRIQLYLNGITTTSQGASSLKAFCHILIDQSTWWHTSTTCVPRNTLYGHALTLHTKGSDMVLVQPLQVSCYLFWARGLEKGFDKWCNGMGMPYVRIWVIMVNRRHI